MWLLFHDFIACWHFHEYSLEKSLKKHLTWMNHIWSQCNSIWPLVFTIGKVSELEFFFQKTPKSKNSQKYPKNEHIWPIRDFRYMVPTIFTSVLVNFLHTTHEYLYIHDSCLCNPLLSLFIFHFCHCNPWICTVHVKNGFFSNIG